MQINKKLKLIISSLIVGSFMVFGKINAMQNHEVDQSADQSDCSIVMLTRDDGKVDLNSWLEVYYNNFKELIFNFVFLRTYDKNAVVFNFDDSDDVGTHHYHPVLKKYLDEYDDYSDYFKFIVTKLNGELVAERDIITEERTVHNGDMADILGMSVNEPIKLPPGFYNVYLYLGNTQIGSFMNVVI